MSGRHRWLRLIGEWLMMVIVFAGLSVLIAMVLTWSWFGSEHVPMVATVTAALASVVVTVWWLAWKWRFL